MSYRAWAEGTGYKAAVTINKGLDREIHGAFPAAFLKMTRTQAEETGSRYEEAPARESKPTDGVRRGRG